MSDLGEFSKELVVARPDGRTREGRAYRQVRNKLIERCGGEKLIAPEMLAIVENTAILWFKCVILFKKFVSGEDLSPSENYALISTVNAFRKSVADLGLISHVPPAKRKAPLESPDPYAALLRHFEGDAAA